MVGIMILNTFTDEQFDKGLSSLIKIMALVTTMQLLSSKLLQSLVEKGAGVAKSILQLVAVAGVVAILAASLIKLSQIEDSAAWDAATDSLSKVITAAGILAAGMASDRHKGVVPALIGLVVVITSLAAIVLAFVGLAWLMDKFDSAALTRGLKN